MKLCTRCGIDKPATTQYFYRNNQTPDGLHGHCKTCKSEMHKKYLSNPEIKKRVNKKIRQWQKGVGKEKYTKIKKAFDTSDKRIAWRRNRFFAIDGECNCTLEQALSRLERLKMERGLST